MPSRNISEHYDPEFAVADSERFSEKHPDFADWKIQLTGTYTTCQGAEAKAGYVPLEDIYRHIFVLKGGCKWCQKRFESVQSRELSYHQAR